MKWFLKTWVLTDEKKIKHTSSLNQTTPWNTLPLNARIDDGPCNQEKNWRKSEKKSFRSKQLEICKTRTEKSSPDVFIFNVILAGQNMVTDAGQVTTCKCKFKARPMITNKGVKNEEPPKNMGFNGKNFEYFTQKKYTSSIDQTNLWNTRSLNAAIDDGPCNQEEINCRKIEKSIQVKTVRTLQD